MQCFPGVSMQVKDAAGLKTALMNEFISHHVQTHSGFESLCYNPLCDASQRLNV